jgi:hypothetical protein
MLELEPMRDLSEIQPYHYTRHLDSLYISKGTVCLINMLSVTGINLICKQEPFLITEGSTCIAKTKIKLSIFNIFNSWSNIPHAKYTKRFNTVHSIALFKSWKCICMRVHRIQSLWKTSAMHAHTLQSLNADYVNCKTYLLNLRYILFVWLNCEAKKLSYKFNHVHLNNFTPLRYPIFLHGKIKLYHKFDTKIEIDTLQRMMNLL